jgi:ParB-like chromosome segregation protein Spo0J
MRTESLAYARKPYSGKSASEAQRIAAHLKEPVTVGVYVGGRVQLIDGRHRAQAAKAAGATKIRAKVIVYGPRGGIVRTYIGKVPL